ncbi:uncharacterized protein [Rutidosis leptorrhynchoides]|uniref:uncharacterized protein n=1 Tax=Rutidosis leptorrhynchoides TaxID=125765 RepID=UPI003A9921BB
MDTDHQIPPAEPILEERHGLVLCQVWPHDYDTNGRARSLFLSDIYFETQFRDYVYDRRLIGDGLGGFTLKALETYETYFSTKFIKGKLKGLIPATVAKSHCFLAICLKNINVGQHVDYAIEMIFKLKDNMHPYVFLDSLFVTLKSCLPSFYFSSGAKLGGHRSLVLDVDTFIELEKSFLEEEDCKEDVNQQHFGTSNSTNLNNNNNTNDGGDIGVMDVRINVSASVEFEDLKTKIFQRFHDLVSSDNNYRLTYSVQGLTRPRWIELESDQDLKKCISLCRSKQITQLPIRIIPVVQHGFRPKSHRAILEIFPEGGSHLYTSPAHS